MLRHNLPVCFRELIRCLKWYMDRSAEVVRQDHIQEAMRVRTSEAQTSSMMSSERENTLLPGVYLIYLNTRAVIAIYIKQLQARKLTNFCSSVFYVCSLFTNIELVVFLWFLWMFVVLLKLSRSIDLIQSLLPSTFKNITTDFNSFSDGHTAADNLFSDLSAQYLYLKS